ncbi:alpha/beta fold hydrolase (plasmid) [Mycolicibacterium psychrotolerans]|uniref:alpha/beta fold hydrolase n=1 Tax=Mycolicibacterium psychrotolerans TaxID=216929 RepID=UPI003D668FE3
MRGSGPALVLLQGQANNHRWWDLVRPDFTDTRTTITFDYRGTGDSPDTDAEYTTRQFALDAMTVLDYIGFARADVYGTSMGGRIAQIIAAEHPERVCKLILGCTAPGGPHSVERGQAVRHRLTAKGTELRDQLVDLMYTPGYRAAHPGPYGTLGDTAMTDAARRKHLRASDTHDGWTILPKITAPTLILHGTDDELTPFANAPLIAQRIPTSEVYVFHGARHAYFEECRPSASEVVRVFLRS